MAEPNNKDRERADSVLLGHPGRGMTEREAAAWRVHLALAFAVLREELEAECKVLREYRDADLAYLQPYKTHDEEVVAWKRLRAAVDALESHDARAASTEDPDALAFEAERLNRRASKLYAAQAEAAGPKLAEQYRDAAEECARRANGTHAARRNGSGPTGEIGCATCGHPEREHYSGITNTSAPGCYACNREWHKDNKFTVCKQFGARARAKGDANG